jgi:aminoglycoside N3'-acetyltransferase
MATKQEAIARCTEPRTRESLAHDMRKMGMVAGMSVLGHVSLSSLG